MVEYRKAKVQQRLVKNRNGTVQNCLSRAAKASSRWETSSNGEVLIEKQSSAVFSDAMAWSRNVSQR